MFASSCILHQNLQLRGEAVNYESRASRLVLLQSSLSGATITFLATIQVKSTFWLLVALRYY